MVSIPKADVNSLILYIIILYASLSIEDIITHNVAPEIKTIIAVARVRFINSIGNGVRISEKEMSFKSRMATPV